MASEANVRSIEALERFRSCMIVFLTKVRKAMDSVSDEVKRTRFWLQTDQRNFWEGQMRKRARLLEQAEAELMTARLSTFKDSTAMQQQAVRKAKALMDEATEKLRKVKQWDRNYDTSVEPLARRLDSIRRDVDTQLPMAISYMDQVQRILDDYSGRAAPASAPPTSAESPIVYPAPEE